jgi:cell fate regulator YaaT (PSP1 superfamily)
MVSIKYNGTRKLLGGSCPAATCCSSALGIFHEVSEPKKIANEEVHSLVCHTRCCATRSEVGNRVNGRC